MLLSETESAKLARLAESEGMTAATWLRRAILAAVVAVLTLGCASAPPPAPVVIERKVYVFVPERSGPPVPPGPGIAESPLLVAAETQRVEHQEALARAVPQPTPDVVYVPTYGYDYGWRDPYPYTGGVVIVDEHRGHHHHGSHGHHGHTGHDHGGGGRHADHHQKHGRVSKGQRERAASRCDSRATKWARERCLAGVARR